MPSQEWHYIFVDHPRLGRPIRDAFYNVLIEEYERLGQPRNCAVYRRRDADGRIGYFFSPEASKHLGALLHMWEAVSVPEPTNLLNMEIVL